jgi:GNAT superfamily N-acetyltransferase
MGEFTVREAAPTDAEAVAGLLGELGYPNTADFARSKLAALAESDSDRVLVAERVGGVVGVAHLHMTELFHQPGRAGRIMAVVVNADSRRLGVGRELMNRLEALAREYGCTKLELTSAAHREAAHAFYLSLGYDEGLRHFVKYLNPPGEAGESR